MRGHRLTIVLLLLVAAVPARALAAETRSSPDTALVLDRKLVAGDITISYPSGLESQAEQLMAVCQELIPPSRERYLVVERAFSDEKAIAQRVLDLLGCADCTDITRRALLQLAHETETLVGALFLPMLGDVRIYREADLKASGGLHTGVIDLVYEPGADRFTFTIAAAVTGAGAQAPGGKGFMPVIVRDDGTFRSALGQGLEDDLARKLDTVPVGGALMACGALVHEEAEIVLGASGFDHPFARWFSEGVAEWVKLQVVAELAPEFLAALRQSSLPRPGPDPFRTRINLLAWPQAAYEREFVLPGERGLSEAHYVYAAELIERLLDRQPPGALAAVVARVKGSQSPGSDAICQAFQEVTGKDASGMLLEYVPVHVREGLAQGLTPTKLQEGYEALSAGRLPQAAARLKEALEMSPSDPDAHLNLALVMRWALRGPEALDPGTAQRRRAESERHIALAAALARRDPTRQLQIHGPLDDEARYVLGRVAQFRGRTEEAKDILSKLPQDHRDARQALQEMEGDDAA